MARVSVADPRVRRLIEKLVPLAAAGSVNSVCERLNAALGPGVGLVYPNRIHALLSEDPARGLNESSLSLIEMALTAVLASGTEPGDFSTDEDLRVRVQQQWRISNRSAVALGEVAEAVAQPPAVVRYLLETAGELPKQSADQLVVPPAPVRMQVPTDVRDGRRRPDWTFQDNAVQKCIQSLTLGPNRKIGLILPTGAGKTRTALRIALSMLARYPSSNAPVLWVTHRLTLRRQAHRELQRMLSEGVRDLPENAAELLAKRIEFLMLSELTSKLAPEQPQPILVIVDEAHHAAAPSYQQIFEAAYPVRGLFLTATPNRTDKLLIGIDEIAYTTTYRELANRGVILLPEFEDFPVPDFDWSEQSLRDLADKLITRAADDYVKTLVITPRIDRLEGFYAALRQRLEQEDGHPLSDEDIGFVHSTANSLLLPDGQGNMVKASAEEFIAHFRAKPRAIIVSAQMLLEGFDDPEINTVVITYPSSSMIVLMQAAGRCVRHTTQKKRAFVLQARNDSIAYHLDQRWLYQEISDYLRPQLRDVEYGDLNKLKSKIVGLLDEHRVSIAVRNRVVNDLDRVALGERCRVLFSGLPYFGDPGAFFREASWSCVLETPQTSEAFRDLFNSFCALNADLSDPSDFLRKQGARYGISPEFAQESNWRIYMDMLTAMYFGGREIYGDGSATSQGIARPFSAHGATTWLQYVTFHYRPVVSPELTAFLQDCHNREAITAEYQRNRAAYAMAVKLPLPMGQCEAYLFSGVQADSFREQTEALRSSLRPVEPGRQFEELASRTAQLIASPVPMTVLVRLERFLSEDGYASLVLPLVDTTPAVGAVHSRSGSTSQQMEDEANAQVS